MLKIPLSDKAFQVQLTLPSGQILVLQADQLLVDGLTSIQRQRVRCGLVAPFGHLAGVERAGVFRAGVIQQVDDGGECPIAAQLTAQLGIEQILLGGTLLPVAIYVQPGEADMVRPIPLHAAILQRHFLVAIATGAHTQPSAGVVASIGGGDVDHATRRVAVEHRGRPTNDLNALSAIQINRI